MPDAPPGDLVRDPVYRQLHDRLRGMLRSGEFPAGARFPTEREIGARFGVSRPTANKALAALVAEGRLEFRKGVGTFVRAGVMDYDLRRLVSFTDQARAAGRRPSTRVLVFRKVPPDDLPAGFRTGAAGDAGLHYVERLRLADDDPVILERRWVSAAVCPDLTEADAAGSLYAAWVERHGLAVAGADETVRAVRPSRADAGMLGLGAGAAALLVTATGFVEGDRPLWWERTLYRGDRWEFRSRLGGVAGGAPLGGHLLA